jgi:glyoxylase-like metal-dependent hydrolase (beta-lactamase superfamily II)
VIPFVRDMQFDYEVAQGVSPLIRRIIARNAGPFTYTGTGTYIIGDSTPGARVCVIDPGPELEEHLEAILKATEGQIVSHIFITHAHMDHSPLAKALSQATGAIIYAGAEPCIPSEGEIRLEAGDDLGFVPDQALLDGQVFEGTGWTLEAMATPGHTTSHYAYILREENALFPGDCIMGWSTTIISPPDGDMGAYMHSLERIQKRDLSCFWPTHGPPVTEPAPFIAAYISHRKNRETQILQFLEHGSSTIKSMVPDLYAHIDRRLYPAAAHSILAHILELVKRGEIICEGVPNIGSVYSLKVSVPA